MLDIFGFGRGKLSLELSKGIAVPIDGLLALIFVPPLTDFSKDPDMTDGRRRDVKCELGYLLQDWLFWRRNGKAFGHWT